MDPVVTLFAIRNYLREQETRLLSLAEYDHLADLMRSLDEWMVKGGFSPWVAEIIEACKQS